MKNGSYVEYLFGVATGWLGWSPKTAWRTPIPELINALDARIDWLKLTGALVDKSPSPEQRKASVADKLRAALRGRRGE